MNVTEILDLTRIRLDDTALPYGWPDSELIQYLNKVHNEWTRDVRCLRDSSTVLVCNISLLASTASYALDNRIISIENAYLSSDGVPLARATEAILNVYGLGWRTNTGTPLAYIPDSAVGKIRIYPYYALVSGADPAATVDTLMMDVVRYPLLQLSLSTPTLSPEIHFTNHIDLVTGIMREAYLKEDSQTFDKQASITAGALFESAKSDAKSSMLTLRDDDSVYAAHDGAL